MTTQKQADISSTGLFRMAVLALSAATGLSALATLGLSVSHAPVSWFFVGFEAIIALAAGFGVRIGLGRQREGVAIALLCVAATVGVGTLLGYIGAGKFLSGWSLKPLLLARGADAAALAACSGLVVLSQDPRRSLPLLARGVVFGAAMVALVAGAWALRGTIGSAGGPMKIVTLGVVSIAGIALVSASGHYLIRAFAVGGERGGHAAS